jgi:hypothetical protein
MGKMPTSTRLFQARQQLGAKALRRPVQSAALVAVHHLAQLDV